MINKLTFLTVIACSIMSCAKTSESDYAQWYDEQKPYSIKDGNVALTMIEYPHELGWITFYKNQLTTKLIDSLYRNSPKIVQFRLTITDSASISQKSSEHQYIQGSNISAFINNKKVMDCSKIGNPINATMAETYLIVVQQADIESESVFTILDNKNQREFKVPANAVLLTNKKKLTL